MVNCVFSGNSAESGGGIFNGAASPTVTNCTFGGNTATDGGGAIYNANGGLTDTSDPVITNCIMWGNTAYSGPQVFSESGSSPIVTFSCIQGGWSGTGNIGGLPEHNPLHADADGPDDVSGTEDDDLHLLPASPCINTGLNAALQLPGKDLDGHQRVLCDIVDMGAFEFGIGDYECDGDLDLEDFAAWEACMTGPGEGTYPTGCEAFDFEYDGDVDLLDFAGVQAAFTGPLQ
jgi:predicted outer membrane repeat protein